MNLKEIIALALLVLTVSANPEDDLIEGTKVFTTRIYKELVKDRPNENIIFSPLSIQTVMALISSASQDPNNQVLQEVRTAVNLPDNDQNTKLAFEQILKELNKDDNDFKVFDANKMYFKKGYTVKPWYQDVAQRHYNSEIEMVNFGDSWNAVNNINEWVAKKTNNKITNFVSTNDITSMTQKILINALYLMGKWDKPFVKEENTWRNFYSPTGTKRVEMMSNNKTYDYCEDDKAQYLKLQMVRDGGDAEMVFVLPKEKQGLSQLENNLRYLPPQGHFTPAKVEVLLPKFKIDNFLKLKQALQNLGVKKLFSFGKWNEIEGLSTPGHGWTAITDVFQKAFIEVNEWGVTAAAASAAMIYIDDLRSYKVFTADHPFWFYITVSDVIVFAGRVMQV